MCEPCNYRMASLGRTLSRVTVARLLNTTKNTFPGNHSVICTSSRLHLKDSDTDVAGGFPTRVGLPIITSRKIDFLHPYTEPKQAWLENIDTVNSEKLGIIDLHPDIFSVPPRMDILHTNVKWQQMYKKIDWTRLPTRAELPGSGKKPWRQKRTGMHRAGSRRAPQWRHGGIAHGPRGPKTWYYMLSYAEREQGLRTALSVKYAQDDLHIVDSLEIPTDDPDYIQELVDTRFWGFSVLFVDDSDEMPVNFTLATSEYGQYNYLPVYGLNVYSMLKHETLVMTLAAVEKIEKKLLEQLHSPYQNKKIA